MIDWDALLPPAIAQLQKNYDRAYLVYRMRTAGDMAFREIAERIDRRWSRKGGTIGPQRAQQIYSYWLRFCAGRPAPAESYLATHRAAAELYHTMKWLP
jgi:hypothetical protein